MSLVNHLKTPKTHEIQIFNPYIVAFASFGV